MKPRRTISTSKTCTGLDLELIEHDDRLFLECQGRQVDASHLGHAARKLIGVMTRPFRPARQPRIVFLGLGFGHALLEAQKSLPQEKASFVVVSEADELSRWISEHLVDHPFTDERVHLHQGSPFDPISGKLSESQGIIADLDHLEALAPKKWSILSESILKGYSDRLKNGGLLGLISTRERPGLEKELRKVGFDVATDLVPLSPNSKKNRTLYLGKKGHYQRSH